MNTWQAVLTGIACGLGAGAMMAIVIIYWVFRGVWR